MVSMGWTADVASTTTAAATTTRQATTRPDGNTLTIGCQPAIVRILLMARARLLPSW